MNFDLSETQAELKAMVARLMRERYGFAARQAIVAGGGFSRELWDTYGELGLLGIGFDEDHGGVGGGFGDVAVVMEELGRALALEPFVASAILAGGPIAAAGEEELVGRIATGETIAALAHGELPARYELAHVETTARHDGESWAIDGVKDVVLGGDVADLFVVTAREGDGVSLFLVERGAAGLTVTPYRTTDDMGAARLTLAGVAARRIGPAGGALPLVEHAHDRATAALCAEVVGAMAAALDITTDYLKTRRQFGATIGSFQALQHKAVDMLVALEHARSLAIVAARYADDTDATTRGYHISAAKLGVDRAARTLGQLAIQLHGGIGVTEEYAIGHYFRRLTAIGLSFGDQGWHIDRMTALAPPVAA